MADPSDPKKTPNVGESVMRDPLPMPPHEDMRRSPPMAGIVNGMIGSLALWAIIAGVVVAAN